MVNRLVIAVLPFAVILLLGAAWKFSGLLFDSDEARVLAVLLGLYAGFGVMAHWHIEGRL